MSAAAIEMLRAAKARIAKPAAWGKGCFRRYKPGDDSLCFCADGALLAVSTIEGRLKSRASLFLTLAARARGFESVSKLNDAKGTGHADVLRLFDDAIRRAKGSMVLLALTGGARGWV